MLHSHRFVIWFTVVMALLVGFHSTALFSQEEEAAKTSGRRLPTYFSQVGLRQSQREQIYGIQDKYAEQIEDLIRQVEALRKARDAEAEQVLDDAQRAELKRLVAEAAARSKTRKAAPAKSSAATPDSTTP